MKFKKIFSKKKEVRHCPKCKSINVKININPGAAVGMPQKWSCQKCGFESFEFPKKKMEKEDKNGKKNKN